MCLLSTSTTQHLEVLLLRQFSPCVTNLPGSTPRRRTTGATGSRRGALDGRLKQQLPNDIAHNVLVFLRAQSTGSSVSIVLEALHITGRE